MRAVIVMTLSTYHYIYLRLDREVVRVAHTIFTVVTHCPSFRFLSAAVPKKL